MPDKLSIKWQIALPIGLILFLGLLAMIFFNTYKTYDVTRKDAVAHVKEKARKHASNVAIKLEDAQDKSAALSAVLKGYKKQDSMPNREVVNAMLESFLEENPQFLGVWTVWEPDAFDGRDVEFSGTKHHDETGRFIPYWNRVGGMHLEEVNSYAESGKTSEFYRIPLSTKNQYVTEPIEYEIGGEDVFVSSFCTPIIVDGRALGVVGIDMGLDALNAIVTSVKPLDSGYGFIIDNKGSIVAHPKQKFISKNLEELATGKLKTEGVPRIKNGQPYTFFVDENGEEMLQEFVPIEIGETGISWSLAAVAPMKKALAHARSLAWTNIALGSGLLLLVLSGIWIVAARIAKVIGRMSDRAMQVANGNFDVETSNKGFKGELLVLHCALKTMLENLVDNIQKAEEKSCQAEEESNKARKAQSAAEEARKKAENAKREGMLEAANQLTEIVERISSASEEMAAQIEESSTGSDNQRNSASEVATAMEEMNASVLEIARNASSAAEGSDTARGKAEKGSVIVSEAVQSINEVAEKAREMQASLKDLGKKANNIGEVMNVINDIADQTNLLALNAAIEAARAGEAGRGFAVVADEVRKLAEKTMNATKEVGEAVNSIQQGTETNIEYMNDAGEMVEKSTSLSNSAGESLREIVGLVQENADQVRNIATASEEQSAASEQINTSTEEINRIASEVADSMQQSAQAISELAALSGDLQNIIKGMKEEK
ncbi:MAG: methyl-accepting chemotaxis protein [Thermodesulfobacteriota bacterium]